jgi:hypothetical protein
LARVDVAQVQVTEPAAKEPPLDAMTSRPAGGVIERHWSDSIAGVRHVEPINDGTDHRLLEGATTGADTVIALPAIPVTSAVVPPTDTYSPTESCVVSFTNTVVPLAAAMSVAAGYATCAGACFCSESTGVAVAFADPLPIALTAVPALAVALFTSVVLPAGRTSTVVANPSVALAPAASVPTVNATRLLIASNAPLPSVAVMLPAKVERAGMGSFTATVVAASYPYW